MPKYRDLSDVSILVVDDTPTILTMVSTLLLSLGVKKVTTADSVHSAREKIPLLTRCPFDLILLDRYLGEESGLELLKNIRQVNKEVAVIMLTQEDEAPKVIEAISLGASDYIVKPFTGDVLVKKLEKALGFTIHTKTPG